MVSLRSVISSRRAPSSAPVPSSTPIQAPPAQDSAFVATATESGFAGSAPPGATIEAINLSSAVSNRQSIDEAKAVGTADASGRFSLQIPDTHGGDFVRLRAKKSDGTYTPWVLVRAAGVDTRNAEIVSRRLALYDDGTGRAAILANPELDRPAAEPFATLRIINDKTGEKTDVTLDALGLLPEDLTLSGAVGDTFSFAISDGSNNSSFALSAGQNLAVIGKKPHENDLPDPRPWSEHVDKKGRSRIGMDEYKGPLIDDGIKPADVRQGYIGDCYLPAAVASVANLAPDRLERMLTRHDDGSYSVTFKTRNDQGKWITHVERVDGDLYIDNGDAVYGHADNRSSTAKMELWWPIIEKAYAAWHGSYDAIGHGGHPSDAFAAILGKNGSHAAVSTADALWTRLKTDFDAKRPAALSTFDDKKDKKRYEGTGVHGNHAYSVLGYEVDAATHKRYVILRNPWGYSEPEGNGDNDGLFKLEIEKAAKYFQTYYSIQ